VIGSYKNLISIGTIIMVGVAIIIVYQILRAIFGGTWTGEDIIIILVIFNLTITMTLSGIMMDTRNKLFGHFGYHKGLEQRLKKQ